MIKSISLFLIFSASYALGSEKNVETLHPTDLVSYCDVGTAVSTSSSFPINRMTDEVAVTSIYCPDLHNMRRSIAFASVFLSNSGNVLSTWKAVDSYRYCMSSTSSDTSTGSGSESSNDSNSDRSRIKMSQNFNMHQCGWSVFYTNHYDFVECEDGRAFINRKGIGVDLTNPTDGIVFEWAEGRMCSDGPLGDGTGDHSHDDSTTTRGINFSKLVVTPKN